MEVLIKNEATNQQVIVNRGDLFSIEKQKNGVIITMSEFDHGFQCGSECIRNRDIRIFLTDEEAKIVSETIKPKRTMFR